MTPPPINIDGTNENYSNVTIDGQDVEQITIDGQDVLSTIPDSGVSRWEFEQDYVDSWDDNDGSPSGSPQFDTDSQVGSHALSLNGSDQYVTVPHNINLEPTELSFGCWFKTSEDGTLQWVIGKDGPRFGISYNLRIRGDVAGDIIRYTVADTSSSLVSVDSTTDVIDGSWHHAVGTLGPTNGQVIYVDGGSENSDPNTSISYNQSDIYIGARDGTDQHFNGLIDDPRVYNKELSATEVSNWHSTGSISG